MADVSPPVVLRRAVLDDVPGLVALLADDHLGSAREAAEGDAAALEPYQRAFMIRWAIEEAGRRGCVLVQLTTDRSRTDAHRFYERLGFVSSHEGMKLLLA
jgi:GNAT superfamily N-acetyltransferase